VQNEHQTLSPGSIAGPTAETDEMQTASQPKSIPCPCAAWPDDPKQKYQRADRYDHHVEPAERRRQTIRILPRKPIAGEAWNDATADQ
jgi:hypothetical protein